MSKKNKIIKRLLVFVLSVAIIFAFTPVSLLSYAEENASEPAAIEEPSSEPAVQKQDEEQKADVNEEEAKDLSSEDLKTEGEEPDPEIDGGTKMFEVDEEDAICRVGDKYYDDLYMAILDFTYNDMTEGTVVLLDDAVIDWSHIPISQYKITITDDGQKRTIKRGGDGEFTTPLFRVINKGYLCFDGTSDENLVIEGGVQPKFDSNGYVVRNSASVATVTGTLELKHATIKGGTISGGDQRGAINVRDGGTFKMSGGIITDTYLDDVMGSAPVFVDSAGSSKSSTFEMSGGKITNNTNNVVNPLKRGFNCAGGVTLFAWNKNDLNSVMNMSGGSIEGNSSYYGGGVYMGGKSEMYMTGGSIKNNVAKDSGGGVCVSGITEGNPVVGYYDTNKFVMDGGRIEGNSAKVGGGVYVNSDAVYLNKGYIENNKAVYTSGVQTSGHGGGVYVSEMPRVLHINNAVITSNTAKAENILGGTSALGGGLWACPTGSIDLRVTNGVAVYGNEAIGENRSAGDDLVKVNYKGGGSGTSVTTVTMADRMLGGGKVLWYQDGVVLNSTTGYADREAPRYDASNPGEPMHFKNESENVAAKAIVSDSAIQRANEEAQLFIRNNEAAHGGGIGTNGDLTLRDSDDTEWTLMAKKRWDDVPEENQKEIEVFLKIDDEILDSVKLNAGNGWTASFENLPEPSSLTNPNITVVEGYYVTENGEQVFKETEEYIVNYATTVDEDNATIWVTITNSSKTVEEPPTDPTETTTEPEETSEVSDTGSSNPSNPSDSSQPTSKNSPSKTKTGDSSNMAIAYWLLILSGFAGVMTVMYRRKKTQ